MLSFKRILTVFIISYLTISYADTQQTMKPEDKLKAATTSTIIDAIVEKIFLSE